MNTLTLAALAGALIALPAAAHAQPQDSHRQGADQGQHDHSAPPAGNSEAGQEAMPQRQMQMGEHMKDCCCPCCQMMQQHGGMKGRDEGEAPAAPVDPHQH